jgi:hypothetical protein
MNSFQRLKALLCAFFCCASLRAAPPTLNSLFPTGVQQGRTIEVTAGGSFDRWPVHGWADHPGIQIHAGKQKGQLSIAAAADTTPGMHWLRLYNEQGASAPRPFFVDTLPEIVEQEPNDEPQQPQAVQTSAVVNGRLGRRGDVDVFGFKLGKGQTLVASLTANRVLGSPCDAVLQLLSADGFVLDENHDFHGLDPQLAYTAPRDGTYLIRVFAFPAVPDAQINLAGAPNYIYRLTLTAGAFVDHVQPLALPAGKPGVVTPFGWNLPAAAPSIPVEAGADSGLMPLAHSHWANTVTVRRQPLPVAVKTPPADRAHPQAVALPCVISGRIETPDGRDVYEFEARRGQNLLFQVEKSTFDSPLTPVLRMTDAAGKVLTQSGDAPAPRRRRNQPAATRPSEVDVELSFTAPADGRFRIEVSDLFAAGSWRHVYALHAGPPQPDYDLRLDVDRFVLAPGKPLEVAVAIERRQGFAGDIDVQARGLPDGVTALPVHASSKDTAVKLVLTATRGGASGPFQIEAHAPGLPGGKRSASVFLADLGLATTHLWLTMPSDPPTKTR